MILNWYGLYNIKIEEIDFIEDFVMIKENLGKNLLILIKCDEWFYFLLYIRLINLMYKINNNSLLMYWKEKVLVSKSRMLLLVGGIFKKVIK